MEERQLLEYLRSAKNENRVVKFSKEGKSKKVKQHAGKIHALDEGAQTFKFTYLNSPKVWRYPFNLSSIIEIDGMSVIKSSSSDAVDCTPPKEHKISKEENENYLAFTKYYDEVYREVIDNKSKGKQHLTEFEQQIIKYEEKQRNFITENLNNEYSILHKIFHQKEKLEKKIPPGNQKMIVPFMSNKSQKKAIQTMLSSDVTLIQGPPGTGKTQVLLNIIANIVTNGERALVLSANNGAIDNVKEKLEKNDFRPVFSRYGSANTEGKVVADIITRIEAYKKALQQPVEEMGTQEKIDEILLALETDEDLYEFGTVLKNKLESLLMQITAMQKKHAAAKIKIKKTEFPHWLAFDFIKKMLYQEQKYLSKKLSKKKINIFDRLSLKIYQNIRWKNREFEDQVNELQQMIWLNEYDYALVLKQEYEERILEIDFDGLQENIKQQYQELNTLSEKQLRYSVFSNMSEKTKEEKLEKCDTGLKRSKVILKEIAAKVEYEKKTERYKTCQGIYLDLFPIQMGTLAGAFDKAYDKDQLYDYVIIDEASQASVLQALAALTMAKKVILVGDEKQLTHIYSESMSKFDENQLVPNDWKYTNVNLLAFFNRFGDFPTVLLKEHYRCNYHIINFCNQKYYDNQLIIFNEDKVEQPLRLVNISTGDFMDHKHYINEREMTEINYDLKLKEIADLGVITPFKAQSNEIKKYVEPHAKVGTVHTYQGREHENIAFSTVLYKNNQKSINHYTGKYNLFTQELLNVAVSRARKSFSVYGNAEFFDEHKGEMYDLIDYIRTYGVMEEPKVHAIFDFWGDEIPEFQNRNEIFKQSDRRLQIHLSPGRYYRSVWEEKFHLYLNKLIAKTEDFAIVYEYPLSNFVSYEGIESLGKKHEDYMKQSEAAIDFAIVSLLTRTVKVAIEINGKEHEKDEVKIRDKQKAKILEHCAIPLLSFSSKSAMTESEITTLIEEQIQQIDESIQPFKWKFSQCEDIVVANDDLEREEVKQMFSELANDNY